MSAQEFRCTPPLRVTPVSDTMVIPSSEGEQLWCPQRSEVWDGEMETEGENCIKISDSNVYGGEHVAIPHPATSSRQQLGARLMFGILQNCTKLSDTRVNTHIGQ